MLLIFVYSFLLIIGLVLSQLLPAHLEQHSWLQLKHGVHLLSEYCLAFIMIRVGMEFQIDKKHWRRYMVDYWVAMTAAAFPWLLCAIYFLLAFSNLDITSIEDWKQSLMISRFAAPTSAGILFSMMLAAGLRKTWVYHKAKVLAIFDDLDTVLLMIPLKMMFLGLRWQMYVTVILLGSFLIMGWKWMNRLRWPSHAWAILVYAGALLLGIEGIESTSLSLSPDLPVDVEVLLPAFVLGLLIDTRHHTMETRSEKRLAVSLSAFFMVLVGLSMPQIYSSWSHQESFSLMSLLGHTLILTLLSNLGKCFVVFCYRDEASLKQRFATAIAMFPRGEVGAGVLMVSLSMGFGGLAIITAMCSLVLNLLLSGAFIWAVRRLTEQEEGHLIFASAEKKHL